MTPPDRAHVGYALLPIAGGTAEMMRQFTIPFAEDLSASIATVDVAVATEIPDVSYNGRSLSLKPSPPALMSLPGSDIVVGGLLFVGGGITASVLSSLANDLYAQVIRKPIVALWNRVRSVPANHARTFTFISDTWFDQDRVLVEVHVSWSEDGDLPDVPAEVSKALTSARDRFVRATENAVNAAEAESEADAPPVVLRVTVQNGVRNEPELVDPARRLFATPVNREEEEAKVTALIESLRRTSRSADTPAAESERPNPT